MSNTPNDPMDDAHLINYAVNAARELKPSGSVPIKKLEWYIQHALKQVERICRRLEEWSAGRTTLPPAVEWLLDNRYLAQREGREAARSFRKGRPLRETEADGCLLWRCAQGLLWAVPDLDSGRTARYLAASVLYTTSERSSRTIGRLVGISTTSRR